MYVGKHIDKPGTVKKAVELAVAIGQLDAWAKSMPAANRDWEADRQYLQIQDGDLDVFQDILLDLSDPYWVNLWEISIKTAKRSHCK